MINNTRKTIVKEKLNGKGENAQKFIHFAKNIMDISGTAKHLGEGQKDRY